MFYIVRHGETNWNVKGICQGRANNPLNDVGVAQAERTALQIKTSPIKHFYCSETLRTRQTAEIFNKHLNMNVEFDDRLGYSFGVFEGKNKANYHPKLIEDLYKNPHRYNADSFEDIYNRVTSFIEMLKHEKKDNVLIVTHGLIINFFKYCVLYKEWNEELFAKMRTDIENASMTELDFYADEQEKSLPTVARLIEKLAEKEPVPQ